jgi:enhancing lycopene biosynthesis protein 2
VKIGLLLSGCGRYDGTDPLEASLAMLALDRRGARAVCVAPARNQFHCVNHLTGDEVEGEERAVLDEAARIHRGKVHSLADFWCGDLQGLIIPGGYGVAKTLVSGFMKLGERRELIPEVRSLMDDLADRGRPFGAIGLGAAVLGAYFGMEMREEDLSLPASRAVIDAERRTVFAPGFLTAGGPAEADQGIEEMVGSLMELAARDTPQVVPGEIP